MDNQKIIIDGLFKLGHNRYPTPDTSTQNLLVSNKYPFDNITLILVSHAHEDHFDSEMVMNCMLNNPSATLLCPQQVIDRLSENKTVYNKIKTRIIECTPDIYTSQLIHVGDIDINACRLVHPGEKYKDTQNIAFLISVNSKTVFHTGDTDPLQIEKYIGIRISELNIDIGFLNEDLAKAENAYFAREFINAKYNIAMHLPDPIAIDWLNTIKDKPDLLLNPYIFLKKMEKKVFNTSQGKAITVQTVYVDSNTGDDKNPGTKEAPVFSINKAAEILRKQDNDIYTIKINPGIYILDHHVPIATEKDMTDKCIAIEASVLPDDPSWIPEKMPVITSRATKGEFPASYHWVVSLLVDESHVIIRGIKFHGYFYPNARYFPVARFNKTKTDLLVDQCLFVGETNSSQIQAGVIAHGDEVKIDHCVFYKVRNTVVFFQDSGNGIKTGNGITNSIIFGSNQAVWTSYPDKDFKFENNIVTNCRYVWAKSYFNTSKSYSVNNCIIVNNQYYKGIADTVRLQPGEFEISERNVTKKGEVVLRLSDTDDKPSLLGVDEPLPVDYLHVIPGSPGYEMGAGLFKHRKQ
jgi:L-ascorbate metabolism protein UlaG (beta-lactamase superfamily)